MLISLEGCIGVGKSTLVTFCNQLLRCHTVYEEAEINPFLEDFYHAQDKSIFAKHVQYTFLFLQERQLRQALPLSQHGGLVVSDFHPLKSLVFSKVIFPNQEQEMFANLYSSLSIPRPDLMVYLKADEHTILSRVRKRQDPYMNDIDLTYIIRVCNSYETFFRSYEGPYITIDTSRLDYYSRPEDIQIPLQSMQAMLNVLSYLKPQQTAKREKKVPKE